MAWVEKIRTGWRMVERGKINGETRKFSVHMDDDTSESREDARKRLEERIGESVKKPETAIFPHFIYYITDNARDSVKIGFSKNPKGRFHALQISNCDQLELIRIIEFPNRRIARKAESFLHKKFKNEISQSMSEWFHSSIIDELKENYWTTDQIMEVMEWTGNRVTERSGSM